ncbi:protocadherin gamma-C4-like isoform X50 [Triplophysa rosa]|uniref:protocadherin gamma-C4-like isoform X50 n=1 Tax=Triplophysa rosa TaxID=992332 RepID=UPI002545EF28|nr:protocadherin gamma-C4-like isoform X50 [Triplophysa rosa]
MERKEICHRSLDWALNWIVLHVLLFATHASELLYSTAEESKPGTIIGHLTKDIGMDIQMITPRDMRIISEYKDKYVDVDLTNGALVVKQTMDRESMCGGSLRCYIRIQISLRNPLEMHSVTIEIVDVNDNAPVFQNKNTSLEVSEAAAGTTFRLESAHDPDVGINSLRGYLLSQNDCFILKVETKSDGSKIPVLVLNKPLDREKKNIFRLILTAVDGGSPEKSGNTSITMHILDVNDNAPVFYNPAKRVTLLENSPFGTLVTTLNASDADHGLNGEISYMFDKYTPNNVLQRFSVDSLTGEIRVTGFVDQEITNIYDVTVLARDKGTPSMESSCTIKIEIIDVNDNTPVISINLISPVIAEDVNSGTLIALIRVRDEDTGKNGEVNVQIPYGLPFKMSSPYKGLLTLMTDGFLDREAVAEYNISVTATDSGSPPRSSQESIVLRLSDVNDNPPVFSQSSYSVDIAENNAPNAPLLSVSASDPDVGENSTVCFSILESKALGTSVSSYVYINPESGQIYATRKFDYEQINAFQIVVQVFDKGTPTLSSNVTVHVFIIDQNDHPPVLIYPSLPSDRTLQFMVPSTAGTGHLVNRIAFVDGDSGHNAWLFYTLSGLDAGMFHIGAHTGELRTAHKLAAEESKSVFSLIVIVKDNGTPSISTSIAINITLGEKASDVSFERRFTSKKSSDSDLSLYLIITLSFIIGFSVLTIIAIVVRWLGHHGYFTFLVKKLGFRNAPHAHQHHNLHLQLNTDGPVRYMEVVGASQDFRKHTYAPGFSTISSRSDFVFVKAPQSTLSMRLSKRLFAHSLVKQKPPNPDWRFPPNQRPGPSGAGVRPDEAGAGAGVIAGTGPWPNPPTEAEQLQALMAAANASEATATLGPRYNLQYGQDYRQNVYIPGSTATLTPNPQQQVPQQALPPPQALPPAEAPKAAQTPASKKKPTKKDKK